MTRKKQPPAVPHCEGQGMIGQGRAVGFAEGEQAKQWVCEEEVEVLIANPPEGQRAWGLLWELPRNLLMRSPR